MKILTLLSTDWHLKEDNISSIFDLVDQKIALCKKHNIDTVFTLGDIFDSRKAQRLVVLDAFDEILEKFRINGIKLIGIPGNHDKTLYDSLISFLKPFRYHPSFTLISEPNGTTIGDFKVDLLPFFEENMLIEKLSTFKNSDSDFLFTHTAFEGSINNDGSKVSTPVKPSLFKQYKTVFSGHYHNQHNIGDNIIHIPSIQQNNYGENSDKGFMAIFDDGSFELINSVFKQFLKVKIDLDELSPKEVEAVIKKQSKSVESSNVRIEFTGDESKLKSIKKDSLEAQGFSIKTKDKSVEQSIELAESGETVRYDSSSIIDEFKGFCETNSLDVNVGIKYLEKRLQDGKKED